MLVIIIIIFLTATYRTYSRTLRLLKGHGLSYDKRLTVDADDDCLSARTRYYEYRT